MTNHFNPQGMEGETVSLSQEEDQMVPTVEAETPRRGSQEATPKNAQRNAEIIWRRERDHLPCSIARAMGLSRNIVLGALHRAGLTDPTSAQAHFVARTGNGGENAKLTADDVRAIRQRYRRGVAGFGYEALAKSFAVDRGTIRGVVKGRTWAHVK